MKKLKNFIITLFLVIILSISTTCFADTNETQEDVTATPYAVDSSENTTTVVDDDLYLYGNDINMNHHQILNQSDERVKNNITEYNESAIEIINEIEIYEYDWIESGIHEDAGFIAQQLESIIPNAVKINKLGESYSVLPIKIIPYIVKSIQELSKEIELLKKEICELKGETYIPKESKKDKWKPSDMSLEEKREFIKSLKRAERRE